MTSHHCILLTTILLIYTGLYGQSDALRSPVDGKYFDTVNKKAGQLEQKLDKQSEKIITQFSKQESKLKRKLTRKDSAATAVLSRPEFCYYIPVYKSIREEIVINA